MKYTHVILVAFAVASVALWLANNNKFGYGSIVGQ